MGQAFEKVIKFSFIVMVTSTENLGKLSLNLGREALAGVRFKGD